MKIKSNFKLKKIAGEYIVLMEGSTLNMTKVISLNESSAWLWEQIFDKDFSEEDLVELLCNNYEVSKEQAATDVSKWVALLMEHRIAE